MRSARWLALSISVVLLTVAWGCSNGKESSGTAVKYASASISVGLPVHGNASSPAFKVSSAADVASITVDVNNGATVVVSGAPLQLSNGVWSGTINNLPIGQPLTFVGHASNSMSFEIFTGITVYTMAGVDDQVTLTLAPVGTGGSQQFPIITMISSDPVQIVSSGTALISMSVVGGSAESLSYAITAAANGGSFNPANGVLSLSGTTGIIQTTYSAPASAGVYAHSVTVTNSQNNSITVNFSTTVTDSGTGGAGVGVQFDPVISAINGQRNGSDVTFTATVSDDGPASELRYLWTFSGGLSFADATTNPVVLQGYDQSASGTLTLTVTDQNGTGGNSSASYVLVVGQFPDSINPPPPPPPPVTGDCIECHSWALQKTLGPQSRSLRQVVGSGGDFDMTAAPSGSRHLFGATTITKWDCTVCHLAGQSVDGNPGIYHNEGSGATGGMVHLRNVDTAIETGTGWAINNSSWTTTDYANLDQFCVGCHDADGASAIAVNNTNDGMYTSTAASSVMRTGTIRAALAPFNSTDTAAGYLSGSTWNTWAGQRARVVNVKDQFYAGTVQPLNGANGALYNGNPSQHAVLGMRYGTINGNWSAAAWTTYNSKKTTVNVQVARETSLFSCADCHVLDAGSGAHGGARKYNMWHSNVNSVCGQCHAAGYANGTVTGSRYSHSYSRSANSIAYGLPTVSTNPNCFICHASYDISTTVSRQVSYGGIHGSWSSTAKYPTSVTLTAYRFFPGTWRKASFTSDAMWGTSTVNTCYFPAAGGGFSACTSHAGGSTTTAAAGYVRPVKY